MLCKELPPGFAEAVVREYEDLVNPMVQKELDFVNSQTCPRCGGDVIPENITQRMIKGGPPRPLARCSACDCLFDPYSAVIVELGNLANLEPAIPIIRPSED